MRYLLTTLGFSVAVAFGYGLYMFIINGEHIGRSVFGILIIVAFIAQSVCDLVTLLIKRSHQPKWKKEPQQLNG